MLPLARVSASTGKRFVKFLIVGLSGFFIQLGLTYLLTEKFHLYYMFSLIFSIGITTITNFTLQSLWTFKK